jgi:tetratricopeptide (TPR) repeat protein
LFRQPEHGDWDSVIQDVCSRLVQYVENRLDWQSVEVSVTAYSKHAEERSSLEHLLETNMNALRMNADHPDAYLDIGATLALLGRHAEATTAFRHVLQLNPDHVAGHLNLAYSLFAIGDYSEGWRHFEWRLQRIPPGQLPPWPMLQRNEFGSHTAGSRLLVHCEQGYGDTILFSRFLPLLADAGYRVIVSCQPPMATLASSIQGVSRVIIHGAPLPVCDYQILLLSLPWLFDSTIEGLPTAIPYLKPGKEKTAQWKSLLERIESLP